MKLLPTEVVPRSLNKAIHETTPNGHEYDELKLGRQPVASQVDFSK
jgi:hypothetical protein